MKQRYTILLTAFLLLISQLSYSQKFRWLNGGGSNDLLNNGAIKGEWVTHMCTDDNGNLYTLALVGDYNIKADTFFLNKSFNAGASDSWNILFMSYDCDGNMRFAKLLESNSNNHCQGLAYHAGKVYVAGDLYNTGRRIGYDANLTGELNFNFTSKFDTSGTYYWTQFVGPDTITTLYGSMAYGSLAVDGQGNIHRYSTLRAGVQITPSITSQWGNYDLKYDPNGNLLSVTLLQSIDSNYAINKVEIDKATNRYYALFEYLGGTTTRSGTVLCAYNANGTQRWKDTTNPRAIISSLRAKADGVYITGGSSARFGFTIGGKTVNNAIHSTGDFAIIGKLNINDGNAEWLYHVDGTNGVMAMFDLTVLPDYSIAGLAIMAGKKKYNNDSLESTSGEGWNPTLIVIDTSGLLIDWEEMHGSGFSDAVKVITSDKVGNVYFGGELINDMQAGSTPKYTSNGGNSDYYIGKFGFDCNCTSMANPTSAFTYTIKDSLKKEIQFTFTGTTPNDSVVWRFGDASVLTQTNPTHIFADTGVYTVCAKVMVPCGRKVICQDIYVPYVDTTDTTNNVVIVNALEYVKIYPNPASEILYVEGLETGSCIELYDIVGRKVHMITTAKENEIVNISYLPEGNYIIQLTDNRGRRMTGKVAKRAPRP